MVDEEEYNKDIYIEQLESELKRKDIKNNEIHAAYSGVAAGTRVDGNLIQYQLDSVEMLDKLEHFYRGDYVGVDSEGNQSWMTPEDKELITLNAFGVSSMMEIVTKYIDKNTALSYYSEQRVYEIMGDIGDDMVLFLLCNYEKMGMDTYFKKTKFRMLISSTLHIIESTYRRAIQGKTSQILNESRIVTQSEGLGTGNIHPHIPKKRTSWFNPSSWK